MTNDISFHLTTTRFDEDYTPSDSSRITTNFANLARGEAREQNLRNALTMIDARCNELARLSGIDRGRFRLQLDIVSVGLRFSDDEGAEEFPLLELLDTTIIDDETGERFAGIVGNNFSSYVRDYDFSVLLPAVNRDTPAGGERIVPEDFGELHGRLFQRFLHSTDYRDRYTQSPVICISVSTSRTYTRTGHEHPVLGVEYQQDAYSLTDEYFAKMGLQVRYFLPRGAVAPLAFYFQGDLEHDYTALQLIGTISTMETFQKIYRPEIYNAREVAPAVYRPSLDAKDFTRTPVDYDRVERNQLALTQGAYTAEHFIAPHRETLEQWTADAVAVAR